MNRHLKTLIALSALLLSLAQARAQEESPVSPDDRAIDTGNGSSDSSATSPALNEQLKPRGTPKTAPKAKSIGPSAGAKHSKPSDKIENIDFQDAEIEDIVRTISQLTGKNFILDPRVKGKISIMAPTAVTVDEVYKAFLSALAINGYTVVPSGNFIKILPARTAQRDSIDTEVNRAAPASDQMVTRIIKFKHLTVADVNRNLRTLLSRDGEMIAYEPTNSLVISDYGSNIRRMQKIMDELDKPGSEERMAVIPVRFAKAKDLAGMIGQLINKGQPGQPPGGQGGARFGNIPIRGLSSTEGGPGGGKPAELSLVTPDERTNSLVVLGNQEGIEKVRALVEELDFNLDPTDGGGVFVYRLKHSVAEQLANTLNGIAAQRGGAPASGAAPAPGRPFTPAGAGAVFGGDVKVTPDKNTNSLIIVASKQDYEIVRGLIAKLDIPRDQVFVEAIIMEINIDKTRDWKIANYYLDPGSKGIGRAGFSAAGTLAGILNPAGDAGAVLGFATGQTFDLKIGNELFKVPSLIEFVNFLQRHADANILSTPQILAMDNEEAQIEVGDQVPIGVETQTTQGGVVTSSPKFDKATIKLTITPHLSPETNSIRMKVDQSVRQASEATVRAAALRDIATIISDRSLKTNIVVENQDTIVLGGLIRDEETHTETKVPFLGDIPVLGWLFKSSTVARKKINLLVFLTPKIIRSQDESRELLGEKIDDRKNWVKQNLIGQDPFTDKIEKILREPPKTIRTDASVSGSTSAPQAGATPSPASPKATPAPQAPRAQPASSPPPAPEPSPSPAPSIAPGAGSKSESTSEKAEAPVVTSGP